MNMAKSILTKFKINTEDFKIYFDNKKKTHVCENIETGEKTNIGCLGILMQMGILKSIDEDRSEELSLLSQRLEELGSKVESLSEKVGVPKEKKEEMTKKIPAEEKPKSEIKERVMKAAMEKVEKDEKPKGKPKKSEETREVVIESDEEIENWMDV